MSKIGNEINLHVLHSYSNAQSQEALPKINYTKIKYTKNKLNIRELEILGSY